MEFSDKHVSGHYNFDACDPVYSSRSRALGEHRRLKNYFTRELIVGKTSLEHDLATIIILVGFSYHIAPFSRP